MSIKSGDTIKAPYTIYSVALGYFHRERNGLTVVLTHIEAVSGKNPLTADEVKVRAEAATRANWAKRTGGKVKGEDYDLVLWDVNYAMIG